MIKRALLVVLCIGILIIPLPIFAAEVLQIRSSSLLQVGDNNRSYTVRLACLEVSPKDENQAKSWLKSQLPRRQRVNLRPKGSEDGVLIAEVTLIVNGNDLGDGLVSKGLAKKIC